MARDAGSPACHPRAVDFRRLTADPTANCIDDYSGFIDYFAQMAPGKILSRLPCSPKVNTDRARSFFFGAGRVSDAKENNQTHTIAEGMCRADRAPVSF